MRPSSLLSAGPFLTLASASVNFKGPFTVEANGVQNINLEYTSSNVDGELTIAYGSCNLPSPNTAHHIVGKTHIGTHPLAKRHVEWADQRPTKFVWLAPQDVEIGCLHAFLDDVSIATSQQFTVRQKKVKRTSTLADVADSLGPWFDGVAYLNQKEPDDVFVASVKTRSFGILGAGMSGLMTAYLLTSAGIHNWKIIESSNRLGGRVHTAYLNGSAPEDYQYQEMGPMRFPVSITRGNETIQILDHRMVFQLADTLNRMNGNDSSLAVNFIRWIQSNVNNPSSTSQRRPDGTVPSRGEVATNSSLADDATLQYSNVTAVEAAEAAYEDWIGLDTEKMRSYATNIFEAHKTAVEAGYLDFSEAGYLLYVLKQDANITDQVSDVSAQYNSFPYEDVYFSATEWRTIDRGLSRLPQAFTPLVANRTLFNSKVQGLAYDDASGKVTVSYLPSNATAYSSLATETFDYVTVAIPFSKVRLFRFTPPHSSLLTRAINQMTYSPSCKVALHYRTRFWEHLERPIFGGCGSTNIPGVGSICYPSYAINSSGPGVLLASYQSGTPALSVGALHDTEHVALIQRAMVEVHGQVAAEQWTGNYDRHCWAHDEHQAGAWASPGPWQQDLYLPAYFQTEQHTVFVGEHTTYTHAWIWSALESAVRGATQLLLDQGLVDEAKMIVDEWMARWIDI